MARKPSKSSVSPAPVAAKPAVIGSSPVRNSPVPRVTPLKKEVTREQITWRAYEIFKSGKGGTEIENWLRAEHELRG
jgi:hypothetical protein